MAKLTPTNWIAIATVAATIIAALIIGILKSPSTSISTSGDKSPIVNNTQGDANIGRR